jgi:hypothetical protein
LADHEGRDEVSWSFQGRTRWCLTSRKENRPPLA